MRRSVSCSILAAALLTLAGCVTAPPVYMVKEIQPFGRIAVLPVSNETNDLDGPPYVRRLIQEKLAQRGAFLVPINEVDAKLKENGFTDGGQLRAAKPSDIGEWLHADTLFYTTLVDFGYINLGFYAQRKVTILGRLMDARTGARLWETQRTTTTRFVATSKDNAKREFALQLAVQAAEKLAHQPLGPESRRTVELLLNTIRYR